MSFNVLGKMRTHFTWNAILVVLMLFSAPFAHAEVEEAALEFKPEFIKLFTEIPSTSMKTLRKSFSKESIGPWLTILGSTAILYHYDEEILQNLQHEGRDLGLGNQDKTRSVFAIGEQNILKLPTDKGSAMYFLGDGWTHMSIAAGFVINGYSSKSSRPFYTGMQMVHGMMVSTIFNQTLKRSFGREAPNQSTQERGAWRPFPPYEKYNGNTQKYDAMPSGHIMTATLMFTVFDTNYPEYHTWTYSIGSVWLTLLAFQMVNNGVHWASDYPLGIGMGYLIGKMATSMGKKDSSESEKENKDKIVYYPSVQPGGMTMNAIYAF